MLKYDVSRSLNFQARIVRQQLQLQSNVNANSYRRRQKYIIRFVMFIKVPSPNCTSAVTFTVKRLYEFVQKSSNKNKLPIVLFWSSRNQLIENSPHHEIFLILLRNASINMSICICLSNFHVNRAPYDMLLVSINTVLS